MSAPRLIKSRRSCIGCGMRPGALHSNGLCATCQRGPAPVALDRNETDPCERGTVGCSVHHTSDRDDQCETW